MTPEQARELLRAAGADGFTAPELCLTPELVAHAPAMAEQIANMRWQYAAQVEKDGHKYIVTDSDEGHWLCGDDHKVLQDWHQDYMDAEDYAYSWNKHDGERTGTTAHVIRRLVGEPEVAE